MVDSAKDVLQRILAELGAANVPYMLTGSFASAYHGTPRTTQDIDIVIAPNLGALKALLRQFPMMPTIQAYGAEGLFNVVDFTSGWKVDFIIRKSHPFSGASPASIMRLCFLSSFVSWERTRSMTASMLPRCE